MATIHAFLMVAETVDLLPYGHRAPHYRQIVRDIVFVMIAVDADRDMPMTLALVPSVMLTMVHRMMAMTETVMMSTADASRMLFDTKTPKRQTQTTEST